MPHKRNPVSSTVILAAHAAAKGHLVTLLDAMAAAGERPVGRGMPSGMPSLPCSDWPRVRCAKPAASPRGLSSTTGACAPTSI